jgi:hypothetical protein
MHAPANLEGVRSELRKLSEEIVSINARPFGRTIELSAAEAEKVLTELRGAQSDNTRPDPLQ